MARVGRGSADAALTRGPDEAFWAIVDANWSADELSELVAMWKAMEDALRASPQPRR